MGLVYADIILSNPKDSSLEAIETRSLVDTGSVFLCIPKHLALQLRLDMSEEREVTIADGTKQLVPYVGPLTIRFKKRQCHVGALVLGDEVLLGAIPLEDMDLVVHPATLSLGANPLSPNIPSAKVK
jgi:clan AA aspartic protease